MKSHHKFAALAIAASALLAGCASTNDPYTNGGYNNQGAYNSPASTSMGYGTIDTIQVVRGSGSTTGSGAVIGGLVGAIGFKHIGYITTVPLAVLLLLLVWHPVLNDAKHWIHPDRH